MQYSSHQPRLIAISSHKGGSGRTTLALNLAAAWSDAGEHTVVVDLDPHQGASLWALHTNHSTASFNPLAMVLAGLSDSEEEGASPVADILGQARRNNAVNVIVDLPAQPDYRSMAVLKAADLILVPAAGSALDADLTASTLKAIRESAHEYTPAPAFIVPVLEAGQLPSQGLRAMGLPLAPVLHRQPELSQGIATPGSKAASEVAAISAYASERLQQKQAAPAFAAA